jgi:hypothetical protein
MCDFLCDLDHITIAKTECLNDNKYTYGDYSIVYGITCRPIISTGACKVMFFNTPQSLILERFQEFSLNGGYARMYLIAIITIAKTLTYSFLQESRDKLFIFVSEVKNFNIAKTCGF